MTASDTCKDVAILIPLYKDNLSVAERFSIENTISVLSSRDIYFIAPQRLSEWLKQFIDSFHGNKINMVLFEDRYFASVDGYNKLMLASSLYKAFTSYEFILIVQTDALVFSDRLNDWMRKQYSYVGSPWFYGIETPKKPLRFLGVGNGGLSLRRVRDFINVLSRPKHIRNGYHAMIGRQKEGVIGLLQYFFHNFIFAYNFQPLFPKVHEDVFWGILAPQNFKYFVVPTPAEASLFSFEVEPKYLYELSGHKLPLGCHAWEKYDCQFWRSILQTEGIYLP